MMKLKLDNVYKKIWNILSKKQKKSLITLFILVLIGTLLETISIGVVIPILNMFANASPDFYNSYKNIFPFLHNNASVQIFLLSMLILVYVIKGIFLSFLALRQNRFSFGLTADISNRLFSGYVSRDYSFHLGKKSAELIRNITTEVGTFTSVLLAGIIVLSEISIVCSIIILLFVVNPFGAIISFIVLSVLGFLFSSIAKKFNILWGSQRHLYDTNKLRIILQTFDGIKEIKHYRKEGFFIHQYVDNNAKVVSPTEKQYTLQSIPRIFFEVVAVIACLGFILGQVLINKDISSIIPQVGMLIAAAFRLMPSFNRIVSSMQTFRFAEAVINSLSKECEELELEKHHDLVAARQDAAKIDLKNTIRLEHISFGYNQTKQVFNDINLDIPHNDFIALVGKSGAGKSTMIDLILGLLKPQKGMITVDGQNIYESINGWRELVGYVPQKFYLFDDTIRYNICFGNSDEIDAQRLVDAVELSQLSSFVDELPLGLDTVIGENGSKLSGGQKQRLAFARALYLKPKVLVLDEPTSSLDNSTEREIMSSLNHLREQIDITIILVTHSQSNLKYCDKVYEIKDNTIEQISLN